MLRTPDYLDLIKVSEWVVSLTTLSNPEAFRSVTDRFGVNRELAHYLFMNTCRQIKQHLYTDFVARPGVSECVVS